MTVQADRSVLTEPFTLPNGAVLRNRLVKAALSEGLARRDHSPGSRLRRLYARWADNGLGLTITGNVMVDRRAIGEPGNVVVEDDRDAADLAAWARTIKAGGSAAWVQLNHPGRQVPRSLSAHPVAPSPVAVPGRSASTTRPGSSRRRPGSSASTGSSSRCCSATPSASRTRTPRSTTRSASTGPRCGPTPTRGSRRPHDSCDPAAASCS